MRKAVGLTIIALVLAGATYIVVRPPATQQPGGERTIAATIFPIADLTRAIAGDRYQVVQILPPGASPHTYELTPAQVKSLAGAQAVFAIGVLDDWIDSATTSLNMTKYTASQGITLRSGTAEDGGEPEAFDPHYWLTVPNAKIMIRNIAARLTELDPAGAAVYQRNLSAYEAELDRLDQSMRRDFSQLTRWQLITFHDSWNYFAAEYGFTIAAVFEASPGKEPVPQYVKNIYETAQADNISAIFSEPTLPTNALEPLVNDLGLKMYILDPEGGVSGVDTYLALMRYNTETIVTALR